MRRTAVHVIQPSDSIEGLVIQAPISSRATPIPPEEASMRLPVTFARSNSDLESSGVFPQETSEQTAASPKGLKVLRKRRAYLAFMAAATVLSFLLDDLRMIAMPREADEAVDSVFLLLLLFFSADLTLQSVFTIRYLGSIPFFLDLMATIGLLGDILLIYEPLLSGCTVTGFYGWKLTVRSARLNSVVLLTLRQLHITTAAKHKKASIEPVEDLAFSPKQQSEPKVFRSSSNVISLVDDSSPQFSFDNPRPTVHRKGERQSTDTTNVRMRARKVGTFYKLYKESSRIETTVKRAEEVTTQQYESAISKRVMKRLVGMVVCIAVLVCGFEFAFRRPQSDISEVQYGLKLIDSAADISCTDEFAFPYVTEYGDTDRLVRLVSLTVAGTSIWERESDAVRGYEKCTVQEGKVTAVFNVREQRRLFAVFDLCETLFMSVLLCFVCFDVSAYVRCLVLFPLERMVGTVQLIWKNPVSLMKLRPCTKTLETRSNFCSRRQDYAEEEVQLLENAFRKIGLMLGLVYGTAGSEMVTRSINLEGEFTAVGKKALAIFAFAKIENFEEALEELGPDILAYINLISRFVHNSCERFMGSVNKNLGDSFLLVWKFSSEDAVTVDKKLILNPYSSVVRSTAGLALLFAVKTIAKIAGNKLFSQYCSQLLPSKVGMITFGFHVGWAFEGPIGSSYKIDASYLSPNVNMAARVETAAQQYNVRILLSHEVYVRVDEEVRSFLRHIDTVKLKGVDTPVLLYSFDLVTWHSDSASLPPNKRKTLLKRKRLKCALEDGSLTIPQLFTRSDTISYLRAQYSKEFFENYDNALILYLAGRWPEANALFRSGCLALAQFDGPTRTLVNYIESLAMQPPRDWRGVRELLYK